MSVVEIKSGGVWVEVRLDGELKHEGHGLPLHVVADLLRQITGVTVDMPEGDFCGLCAKWTDKPHRGHSLHDSLCLSCLDEIKGD